MTLAPVGISVYKRLSHIKKTIESLQKNTLASESELHIFSDGPKTGDEKEVGSVRKYIKTIKGFKKIYIYERRKNNFFENARGNHRKLLEKYGKCIYLEEDIVTARGFLAFMNEALDTYVDREDILNITAYVPLVNKVQHLDTDSFLFQRYMATGVGTWKDKFDKVARIKMDDYLTLVHSPNKINYVINNCGENLLRYFKDNVYKKNTHYDVQATFLEYLNGYYTLYPKKALALNIGYDGSGMNSAKTNKFNVELWCKTSRFNFDKSICINNDFKREMAYFYSPSYEYMDSIVLDNIKKQLFDKKITNFSFWCNQKYLDSIDKKIFGSFKINHIINADDSTIYTYKGIEVITPEEAIRRGERNIVILSLLNKSLMKEAIGKLAKDVKVFAYEPIIGDVLENIVEQIQRSNVKTLSIWGIDNISDDFIEVFAVEHIAINYYIDSEANEKQMYKGIEVITPEEAIRRGERNIVILSLLNKSLMKEAIGKLAKDVKVFAYEPIIGDVLENIVEQIQRSNVKTLSIWGIDNISDDFIEVFAVEHIAINYYIDSEANEKQMYKGIEVITPEEAIRRGERNIVILSLSNKSLMKEAIGKLAKDVKVFAYEGIT